MLNAYPRFSVVLTLIAALVLFITAGLNAADLPPASAAKLLYSRGEVRFDTGSAETGAEGEAPLMVSTGSESTAVFVLGNAIIFRLGSEARLNLDELVASSDGRSAVDLAGAEREPSVSRTSMRLAKGNLMLVAPRLLRDSQFSVETPAGNYIFYGGVGQVVTDASGAGSFLVSKGKADVILPDGSLYSLDAGELLNTRLSVGENPAVEKAEEGPMQEAYSEKLVDLAERLRGLLREE